MIGRAEIERALLGTWRLFLDKPDALTFFDTSVDGFWRSFQAILLVAPSYAVAALADRRAVIDALPAGTFDEAGFWAAKAVGLGADWVAFPVLLAAIAGFIGVRHGAVAYIAVRNWAAVPLTAPFAALAALQAVGVDQNLLFVPWLVALGCSLRLTFLIARRTLAVPVDFAIALVALDWLLSLAIVLAIDQITGYALSG